jgi:hypothetical protein
MGIDYGWQKLHEAVDTLASGRGTIQQRLRRAYAHSLMLVRPEEHLPEELRGEFEAVCHELTKVPPTGDEAPSAATTGVMTEPEASKIASRIVSWYAGVTRCDAVEYLERNKSVQRPLLPGPPSEN